VGLGKNYEWIGISEALKLRKLPFLLFYCRKNPDYCEIDVPSDPAVPACLVETDVTLSGLNFTHTTRRVFRRGSSVGSTVYSTFNQSNATIPPAKYPVVGFLPQSVCVLHPMKSRLWWGIHLGPVDFWVRHVRST
jgi:hypothetical protein